MQAYYYEERNELLTVCLKDIRKHLNHGKRVLQTKESSKWHAGLPMQAYYHEAVRLIKNKQILSTKQ